MKIKHLYYHAITALALFVAVVAAPAYATLNDTGIITCSNETENGLLCPADGFPRQDAEYGRDAAAIAGTLTKIGGGEAGFDFTKLDANGNELPATATNHSCVRDNVTGLIWEVKTNDGGLRDQNHTYTWYDSNSTDGNLGTEGGDSCYQMGRCDTEKYTQDVNSVGLCGFNDWRMPTIKELMSIAHYGRTNPAIDPNYFPDTMSWWFWSGSPSADSTISTWYVHFYSGDANGHGRNDDGHVRLVRGVITFDSFVDNGDGTVTQGNTELMWAKCSEGQTGVNCTGNASTMKWNDALTAANNSRLGGYSDWRLPSVKELQALADYSRYSPAIDTAYFPNTEIAWFWSGSPNADFTDRTWGVYFDYGYANYGSRDAYYRVRLVRDTQSFNPSTPTYSITTAVTPANSGTVNCTPNPVASGGTVNCTATANAGYEFDQFNGDCTGTTCQLTNVTANKNVTANFIASSTPPAPVSDFQFSLTLNGGGRINSDPGLNNNECSGVVCTGTYPAGTVVTLTAEPNDGWQFQGWGGACTGIEACVFTMTAATEVTANFTQLTNQYQLDSPVNGSYESGIGVVHGWVCNANNVTVQVDNATAFDVAYGADRIDSQAVCNDTNNGFAAAINWAEYGNGEHTLKIIADGQVLTSATVTVTTLGGNFLTGLNKTTTVADFPVAGQTTQLGWSEPNQNFVVTNSVARSSIERAANGNWESPTDGGIESGRALIRGWICDAGSISFTLDGNTFAVPYGSGRGDTQIICGDANNGYALAINWNDYGDGAHQMALNIDGAVVATRQFTIATPGGLGSIAGVQRQHTVIDFPNFGDQLTLQWSEPHQNFRITNYQASARNNAQRITEIYIATMGYAPDNEGLQYWLRELQGGVWTPETIATAFFDAELVQARYPEALGYDGLIDALYQNIFGRLPDEGGKTYWLGELNAGHVTRAQMIIALIEGGWANSEAAADMARFGHQVQVGLAFANAQAERGIIYTQLSDERKANLRTLGASVLGNITADPASVTAAIEQIPGLLDSL